MDNFCFSNFPAISRRNYRPRESLLRGNRNFYTAISTRTEACHVPRKHRLSRISGKKIKGRAVFLGLPRLSGRMLFFARSLSYSFEKLFLGEFWFFHTLSVDNHAFHPFISIWVFALLSLIGICSASKKKEVGLVFASELAAVPFLEVASVDS